MAGPKSEPPIPIFTISVKDFPVYPVLPPAIISFEKDCIFLFTSTSGTIFFHLHIQLLILLFRNAALSHFQFD
jgi:hypothetical protein